MVLNFTILEDSDQGDYSVMVSEYGEGNRYDIVLFVTKNMQRK